MAERKQIPVYGPEGLVVWVPADTPQDKINQIMTDAYAQFKKPSGPPASVGKDVIGRVGVGQGLGMGFGDEAMAFARSQFGGEEYEKALADERARIAQAKQDYPVGSTVAEVGGALAPAAIAIGSSVMSGGATAPAAAPVVARTGSLIGNMLSGSAKGAGIAGFQGLVEGFGKGEGGFENRAQNAINTAGTNAVAGGVLGAAIPAATGVARSFFSPAKNRGADWLLDQIARDNMTPQQMAQDYAARQATGAKPEILADIYPGSAVAAETNRVFKAPGTDRSAFSKMLVERMDEQGPRVRQAFEQAVGTDQKFYPLVDALEKTRSVEAGPLYQAAMTKPVRNASLDALITRAPDEAFDQIRKLARYEGLDIPDLVGVDRAGRRKVIADYGVREIDLLKQGLDNIIDNATEKVTGEVAKEALPAVKLKKDILRIVDNLVPEYASARAKWAGPTAVRSAMNMGQRIFNERAEQTVRDIAELNASEKEGFLIGVLDAVNQRIGRKIEGQDVTNAFRGGNAKEQIAAALTASGKKPAEVKKITDALFESVEREATMAETNRTLRGGSPTYQLTAQDEAFRDSISTTRGFLDDLQRGVGLQGATVGAARRGAERVAMGMTNRRAEDTNRWIADVLSRNNPQTVQEAMDMLAARSLKRGQYALPRSVIPGLLADPVKQITVEFPNWNE